MMTSLPNISQAYRILVAEKKHKDIGKQSLISSDALGFVTERNLHNNKQSYSKDLTSRPKGSNSRGKNHSGNKKHNIFYFDHCHMTGHTIDRCYKLHGYPSIHTKNNSHRNRVLPRFLWVANRSSTIAACRGRIRPGRSQPLSDSERNL